MLTPEVEEVAKNLESNGCVVNRDKAAGTIEVKDTGRRSVRLPSHPEGPLPTVDRHVLRHRSDQMDPS